MNRITCRDQSITNPSPFSPPPSARLVSPKRQASILISNTARIFLTLGLIILLVATPSETDSSVQLVGCKVKVSDEMAQHSANRSQPPIRRDSRDEDGVGTRSLASSLKHQIEKRSFRSRPKIGSKIMRKITPTKVLIGAYAGAWAYRKYTNMTGSVNQTEVVARVNDTDLATLNGTAKVNVTTIFATTTINTTTLATTELQSSA